MTKNGLLDFVVGLLAAAFFYRMLFASIKCLPFDCKVFVFLSLNVLQGLTKSF